MTIPRPSSFEISQALKVLENAGTTFRANGSNVGTKLTAEAVAMKFNRVGESETRMWMNWGRKSPTKP